MGSKLRASLDNLASLPAMPAIAQKLLALKLDTEAGEAQMLVLIEQDPQIFARVIGLANSSAVGAGRKITSIRNAAALLGMKRLKAVAVGIATMSKMASQLPVRNFDPQDLSSHCMTIAIVMNMISREMPKQIRPDESQIFLAGMLHDIGLMALHFLDTEASEELHRQLRLQPRRPICDVEMELFGMTHCDIGAKLVQYWQLPKEIIDVVGLHHARDMSAQRTGNPLVRLVSIAERLLPDFGIPEHTHEGIAESEWNELCVDPAIAGSLSESANELALQMGQLPDTYEVALPEIRIIGEAAPSQEKGEQSVIRPVAPVEKVQNMQMASSPVLTPLRVLIKWIGGLLH